MECAIESQDTLFTSYTWQWAWYGKRWSTYILASLSEQVIRDGIQNYASFLLFEEFVNAMHNFWNKLPAAIIPSGPVADSMLTFTF